MTNETAVVERSRQNCIVEIGQPRRRAAYHIKHSSLTLGIVGDGSGGALWGRPSALPELLHRVHRRPLGGGVARILRLRGPLHERVCARRQPRLNVRRAGRILKGNATAAAVSMRRVLRDACKHSRSVACSRRQTLFAIPRLQGRGSGAVGAALHLCRVRVGYTGM